MNFYKISKGPSFQPDICILYMFVYVLFWTSCSEIPLTDSSYHHTAAYAEVQLYTHQTIKTAEDAEIHI